MNEKIIVANWKMNKTAKETSEFFRSLKTQLTEKMSDHTGKLKEKLLIVCPPFTSLHAAHKPASDIGIKLGAQDIYFEEQGAFTGEISANMLNEFGVEFVMAGHSERRHIIGESDSIVNKKVLCALKNKMIPILCVGEKLEQRKAGAAKEVVGAQLKECLAGVTAEQIPKVIIAYEPIWAIGTGRTATSGQAQEMHAYIRNTITRMYNKQVSRVAYILYGGSVNKNNAAELAREPDINGLLVGGASLDAEHFAEIVSLT